MKKNKRLMLFITFLILILSCLTSAYRTEARAATRTEILQKVKKLKSDISILEKKYKTANANYEKKTKGLILLSIFNNVISNSPYVIEANDIASLFTTKSYYWVLNPDKLDSSYYGVGYVKKTGKYRYFNGIACTECIAVKVGKNHSSAIKKKISSKKNEIDRYEAMLEDEVEIHDVNIIKGGKSKLDKKWTYSGKGNSLTYKSSNPEIASVDTKGVVHAKKVGTTTITVKASVSGSKSSCKVNVVEPITEIEFEKPEYVFYKDDLEIYYESNDYNEEDYEYSKYGDVIAKLKYKTDVKNIKGINNTLKVSFSDKSVASYDRNIASKDKPGELSIIIHNTGITDIKIETEDGVMTSCKISVYQKKIISLSVESNRMEVAVNFPNGRMILPINTYPELFKHEGFYGKTSKMFPLIMESSDESVAEVKGFYIFPKKVGETIIKIRTLEGLEASIKVNVIEKKEE